MSEVLEKLHEGYNPQEEWGEADSIQISEIRAVELLKHLREVDFNLIFMVKFERRNPKEGADPIRLMVCRFGVTRDQTGKGMRYNPDDYNLITVWDMQAGDYRHINLEAIREMKISGQKYQVVRG